MSPATVRMDLIRDRKVWVEIQVSNSRPLIGPTVQANHFLVGPNPL